jgi:Anti-sigma-K factor rskA
VGDRDRPLIALASVDIGATDAVIRRGRYGRGFVEAARPMPTSARPESNRPSTPLKLATPATPASAEREPRAFDPLELPPSGVLSGATLATLAALSGMAAIALGLWAFVSSVREEDAPQIVRPPISEAAQAISLLSKPTTVRLPLAGSDGRVVLAVASSGRGILVLDGLGIAPVGRAYQAWVLPAAPRDAEPLSAALFTGVETVVPLSARVQPGSAVGISLEKASGASAPTRALTLLAQRPP